MRPESSDDTAIDLDLEARLEEAGHPDLLEQIAVTLGSTLDLREVLRSLAELVREATNAKRCSVVLIDGDRLKPAVALGARPDDDLWAAFRSMPPIHLEPHQWTLLRHGRVIAWADARTSPHIPATWVERFDLRAVALVPLLARREPCGVMAVDWPEVRHIGQDELALLEAIGTYAGLAVHNARLHERVARKGRTLEHMVAAAAALNSSSSLSGVLHLICEGYQELLGAIHVSVNLVDPAEPLRVRTLATRGAEWFSRPPQRLEAMAPEEMAVGDDVWRASTGPIVYPHLEPPPGSETGMGSATIRSAALFPLFGPDGLIGSVVTGFPEAGGPKTDELDTGQTLAELAAAAVGRADLHDQLHRRIRQLEVLARLADVVTGAAHLDAALGQANEALAPELGLRLRWVAVADASLRDAIGGRVPDLDEEAAVARWREALAEGGSRALGLRQAGDDLVVPLVYRRTVQGALRVARRGEELDVPDEEFVLAVGAACGEVLHRAILSRTLTESERRLAISAERERIAHDLHDSVGQLLTGMGLKLGEYVPQAPDALWQHRLDELLQLARRGEREMREAIYSLLFVQVREEGLVRSLHDLAERFEITTGIGVAFRVAGRPEALASRREDVLFRVAHEALSNVERHARASHVDVLLAYGEGEVMLEVRDDGVGLPGATVGSESGHFGLQALSRRVVASGGAIHFANADGGGVVVAAVVPVG